MILLNTFEITFRSPIIIERASVTKTTFEDFGKASRMGNKRGTLYFLNKGQKLMAVKFYKFRTGLGLREAKDWVDELQLKHYPDGLPQWREIRGLKWLKL